MVIVVSWRFVRKSTVSLQVNSEGLSGTQAREQKKL
jgi:hypothetical protein